MPRPLPFKIRALVTVAGFFMKLGLLPSPEQELAHPHSKRLQGRAMGLPCGPGDPSIRT